MLKEEKKPLMEIQINMGMKMKIEFRAEVKDVGKLANCQIEPLTKIGNKFYAIGFESDLDGEYGITDLNGYYIECKRETRAIHFEGMIDSEGTKVFASLSEAGVGGDLVTGFCRDINGDELIGFHKPLEFTGVIRLYNETAMSIIIETSTEIIASTKDWHKPLVARQGEALRWSDCRQALKAIGIQK